MVVTFFHMDGNTSLCRCSMAIILFADHYISIYAFNQNVFFILTKTRQCNVAVTNINADFDAIKIGP